VKRLIVLFLILASASTAIAGQFIEHMVEIKPQGHSWGFWRDSLIPAFCYIYAP